MKKCPQCSREYDNSMSFCLDDGAELLYGPASGEALLPAADEPATAILHETAPSGENPTRSRINTTQETAILPDVGRQSFAQTASLKKPLVAAILAILLLVVLGVGSYSYLGRGTTKQIESIAVMPFVNGSGNPDVEYLSDGMTETLISSLSQLPNLNVKGRSSVFRYKGRELDAKTVGKELGVQAVLLGRVIQRGELLTLSLELLDAATENVIWSGKYDRKQADIVTLQAEIARDVSNKLKARISGADTAKVQKEYTADAEAYKLYLQGRFYWNKRTEADLKKSVEYFDQAIERDPGYALAYSGLGAAYQVMPGYTLDPPPKVVFPKAREASLKALEIDPMLAEPHATLAVALHEYEWKHSEAEVEYKRAIELDPAYPSGHQWYGNFLLDMGRFQEGTAELKLALELDQFSPIINANLGRAYRSDHRYDDSIAQYLKTLEILPNFRIAEMHLNETYLSKGMYEEVIERYRQSMLKAGLLKDQVDKEISELQAAYHTSGGKGFWQKGIEREILDAKADGREPDPYTLAVCQLGAGNKEQALDSLEKALALGPDITNILWLKAEPNWDPLRTEPRFKEILRKLGLPE